MSTSSSEAAKAAIIFHNIRRLSSSSSSSSSSSPPSSPSENDWFPFQNAAEFNLNIAVALIFLVCFVIGALALNAILRCLHSDYPNRASSSSSTTATCSSSKLNQMSMGPTLVFSTGINLAGADHAECAICLSEFVEGEGVRVLPRCKHGFHDKCIESWLSSKTSCPTCRTSCLKVTPEKSSIAVDQQNDVVVDVVESGNPTPPIVPPSQQQQQQQHRQQEEEHQQQQQQQQQQQS